MTGNIRRPIFDTRTSMCVMAACLWAIALVVPALGQGDVLFDGGLTGTGTDYLTADNWVGDAVPSGAGVGAAGATPVIGDPGALSPAVANLSGNAPAVWELKVGRGASAVGTMNHSAGTVVADNWIVIGDGGGAGTPANGTYNLTGTGSVTAGAAGDGSLAVGAGGAIGDSISPPQTPLSFPMATASAMVTLAWAW